MEFEWDDAKNLRNELERGLGFADAARVFADHDRLERQDTRHDYGETRFQTVGKVDKEVLFVAFTYRDSRIRIISARKAHDNEQRAYYEGKAAAGWDHNQHPNG